MAKEIKLREICEKYDISRRAIQGYETYGLIKPSGKTSYGHLLYDYETVIRIVFIKFLQDVGFSLKEISRIISLDSQSLAYKLDRVKNRLEERQIYLSKLQKKISDLIVPLSLGQNLNEEILNIIMEGENEKNV